MSAFLEASTPDEMPDPSASLIEVGILIEAWLMTVPRKESLAFLVNLSEVMLTREEMMQVVPIRRGAKAHATHLAHRQALADLRQKMSVWVTRLRAE